MQEPLKVIFTGGPSRSGSTLLNQLLGQVPGVFASGELRHIWQHGFNEDRLCGCGSPFSRCDFWREVVERAYAGFENVDAETIEALRVRVEGTKTFFDMTGPLRARRFRDEFQGLRSVLVQLYQSIRDVSGSSVIADSSKVPSYGYLLSSLPGIELHVIHLVRDARAVAFSWTRPKPNPEIQGRENLMRRYSPIRSALAWDVHNLSLPWLRRRAKSYTLVRYEDFIARPVKTLESLLSRVVGEAPALDFLSPTSADLRGNHTIAGNPGRFVTGPVDLRLDDEWKRRMPRSQKALVTALTWPLLLKYRYN